MEQRYKHKIFTIPNGMSFFRLCLIPLIVWEYSFAGEDSRAGWLLILSGVTDILDGFLARRYHMISDLGKVLDPIADKLTQTAMLVCLLLREPLMALPLGLLVLKELFMTISGLLVIRRTGMVLGANWHGKAATVALYGTMFLHVFWQDIPAVFSHGSVFLCSGMILLSFFLYGLRNIRVLRSKSRKIGA